jgi:valyl-tRNA synthetase
MLAYALDRLLRLLHPIMPFVTEEIWQHLNAAASPRGLADAEPPAPFLVRAQWPAVEAGRIDRQIESQFVRFQQALSGLRDIRAQQNIAPRKSLSFVIRCESAVAEYLSPLAPYFQRMANATSRGMGPAVEPPPIHGTVALPGMEIFVDMEGLIDVAAERARLTKEMANVEQQIQSKQAKLSNAKFVDRAPPDVVQNERDSLARLQEQRDALAAALSSLGPR